MRGGKIHISEDGVEHYRRARAFDLLARRVYYVLYYVILKLIVSGAVCVQYAFSVQTGRSSCYGFL